MIYGKSQPLSNSKDYDIIYPLNSRQGFDGGLNSKFGHLISDNESPSCANIIFENGAVETRGGTTKLNTLSVGSYVGHGLWTRHDSSGAEQLLGWWNGTLYEWNGSTSFTTQGSAQSIFTAGVRVCAAEYENYIYFNNGYNDGYKFNGTDFNRHGIPAPTTTSTVASNAVGVVNGDVQYKVTNVNSGLVESDVGPATATFAAANGTMRVSSIPTAPASHGVIRRKLYRSDAGDSYKLVTTLNDNTTTTYDDNVATASLGATAPTDQGEPPKYSFILTHMGRLFCNDTDNPDLVWYSEIDNPYVFKATSFLRVGDVSGELVRGLEIHDNGVVVTTDTGCWLIYMLDTDPTNWTQMRLRSSYGCKSPFGMFRYNNKVMFPAIQNSKLVGFAALSGDSTDPDATLLTVSAAGSDLKSNVIEPDVFNIQTTYIPQISAQVFKNKAYISVTYGDGNTANNRIYVFDFSISNLLKTNKKEYSWAPWTGLSAEQFAVYSGKLYYQSSTANGRVYEMNTSSYNDDGSAIDSYYWTKQYSGNPGDEQFHKDFRYLNLLYEKAGDYFMDIYFRTDSDSSDGNRRQINLDPGGSLWGTMVWGVDDWGGGNDDGEDRLYLSTARGKRIQFKFTNQNTLNQKFKIVGMQFSYNRKGRR